MKQSCDAHSHRTPGAYILIIMKILHATGLVAVGAVSAAVKYVTVAHPGLLVFAKEYKLTPFETAHFVVTALLTRPGRPVQLPVPGFPAVDSNYCGFPVMPISAVKVMDPWNARAISRAYLTHTHPHITLEWRDAILEELTEDAVAVPPLEVYYEDDLDKANHEHYCRFKHATDTLLLEE